MGAQLRDNNASLAADSRDFLTIRLALSCQSQVEIRASPVGTCTPT